MEAKYLCEYVAMPRPIFFPVTLWCLNVSTRFKTLKDLSAVAVEGGIVSNNYSDTSFCLQVPMSHKDGMV